MRLPTDCHAKPGSGLGRQEQCIELAARHHGAGDLPAARRSCEQVLARDPNNGAGLHLLGLVASDEGQPEEAIALIRAAIDRQPAIAHYHCNLGVVLARTGRFAEALAAYDAAIRIAGTYAAAHHNRGHCLREQGRLTDAEAAFRTVIGLRPQAPEAHNDLGVVLERMGRAAEALAAFEQALRLAPEWALACCNRGNALAALGRWQEAVAAYAEAHRLDPALASARLNRAHVLARLGRRDEALAAYGEAVDAAADAADARLGEGVLLEQSGRCEAALAAYDKALRLRPDLAAGHNNRGNVLKALGRFDDALAAYDRALALDAGMAIAHSNRAELLTSMGRQQEALAACAAALERDPGLAEAEVVRGIALLAQGRVDDALAAYDRALIQNPALAEAHFHRGNALREQLRLDEATRAYDRAIAFRPQLAHAHNNLGIVLQAVGRTREALAALDKAIAIDATRPAAQANRANVLMDQGRFAEAALAFERTLELAPQLIENHSNYLNCLNYDPTRSDADLLAAHVRWGERHGRPECLGRRHRNDRDPDRPLRVGLVSADLGRHPVGYLLQPLMEAADPAAVGFHCYSGRLVEDDLSARLRSLAQAWQRTERLADAGLAEAIEADGIDILIDLAGHTAGNRLGCFALKPAPVQVHWAGYGYTTGLAAIDYALWDRVHVPEGCERWLTETVVRLPVRWCYAPPEYAPPVAPPPLLANGHVTFGSFNNLSKLSPDVVDAWSAILAGVAGSRLLLSWKTLADPGERERIRALFAARDIAPERLELTAGAPAHAGVLAQYGRVDIALDPFPYSGGLSTLEALWMGVPVVTLPASRPVSRQSAGLLAALGRREWIAPDRQAYFSLALDLASDPERLAATRDEQRGRMAASPLCDGVAFSRAFETALRRMWHTWSSATAPARP